MLDKKGKVTLRFRASCCLLH